MYDYDDECLDAAQGGCHSVDAFGGDQGVADNED